MNFTARNVSALLATENAARVSAYNFALVAQPGGALPVTQVWRNGEKLYVDCAPGQNQIVTIIEHQILLDRTVNCDE